METTPPQAEETTTATMSDASFRLYWSIMIEEYKSLRDESKQASINMFTAFQWGSGFVGLALAAGFSQLGKSGVAVIAVFSVLVPLLSGMAMLLWLGEALRFKRAGDYICLLERRMSFLLGRFEMFPSELDAVWCSLQAELEQRLNLVADPAASLNPLGWETWLRNTRVHRPKPRRATASGHLHWAYLARLVFFPIIMNGSYILACFYVGSYEPAALTPVPLAPNPYIWTAAITGAVIILGSHVVGLRFALILDERQDLASVSPSHTQAPEAPQTPRPGAPLPASNETRLMSAAPPTPPIFVEGQKPPDHSDPHGHEKTPISCETDERDS